MKVNFSAARGREGTKTYYKDFFAESEEMRGIGRFLKRYAVSSYFYGDGVTAEGFEASGHKAGVSVIGAGNALLFDFDSKYEPVTFDMLCDKLEGVCGYIAPSKGWSEEVEKYHVVVALDQDLPLDKDEFKELYRAVAQSLGLDGLYDPAMESWTQQLSPHFRDDAPEGFVQGEPVDCAQALADYEAPAAAPTGGVAGAVPEDAVFTLSTTGERLDVAAMLARLGTNGKVRVHCLAGLLHDGRADTAFVSTTAEGGAIYHCSGGRCGHTLVLPYNPFTADGGDTTVETRAETLRDIIDHSAEFGEAVNDPKASKTLKEAAISYAMGVRAQRELMAMIEGDVRRYTGSHWELAFGGGASEGHNFIRDAIIDCGFPQLAHENAFTNAVYNFFMKNLSVWELEDRGNYLNLRNGVLRIDRAGVAVLPHSPDYLFTSVLDYDYDPAAACPVWETVVDRVMCGDADTVSAFQETLGYLMLRETNFEKMVGFVGDGENGKSTVLKVLKMLVGRHYSAQPIKTLVKDGGEGAYARAALTGKLINVTNELTPATLEADAFKDLISGEDIVARKIYGSPFTLATVPKQVVAMNSTDALIRERTHGFERRLHLIPFNYRLRDEHKDDRLFGKLEAERSGILNWVLEGARRVTAAKKLSQSDAMRALFAQVKLDADPVMQFVQERLEPTDPAELTYDSAADAVTDGAAVLLAYRDFCTENGYYPLGRNKFLTALLRHGLERVDTTKSKKGRPLRKVKGWRCRLLPAADSSFGGNVVKYPGHSGV